MSTNLSDASVSQNAMTLDDAQQLHLRVTADSRDIDICGLPDGLMIHPRVCDDNHPGLLETPRDIVGEVTGCEATGDGLSARKTGVLEHGTVTVRSGGDDTDVVRVVDGREDSCGQDEFLPGLADVDDVDTCSESAGNSFNIGAELKGERRLTIRPSLPDVRLHRLVAVLSAEMALRREEELDVLLGRGEGRGTFVGRHGGVVLPVI